MPQGAPPRLNRAVDGSVQSRPCVRVGHRRAGVLPWLVGGGSQVSGLAAQRGPQCCVRAFPRACVTPVGGRPVPPREPAPAAWRRRASGGVLNGGSAVTTTTPRAAPLPGAGPGL